MSNQKFAPIRPHFAPEPKPTEVRNKAPCTPKKLSAQEQAQAAGLAFKVKCLEASLESWHRKLESAGLVPSREQMIWNTRQRYAPITPYWLDKSKPGDTRR